MIIYDLYTIQLPNLLKSTEKYAPDWKHGIFIYIVQMSKIKLWDERDNCKRIET
jgi:hypothetical protein